jgi:hypothetical protein
MTNKRSAGSWAAIVAGLCLSAAPIAFATTTTPAAGEAKSAAAAETPKPVVDQGALKALSAMSAYLKTLPGFEAKLTTRRSQVDGYGQVLTFDGESTYRVQAGVGFVAAVSDVNKARTYVYDGHQISLLDPATGFYAQVVAPAGLRQAVDFLANTYDINLPLDDLFRWDEGDAHTSVLTSALYVGETKLQGQDVDQYAYRQAGVDWQIWITRGDKPVPLRVVIIGSNDPAKPQFSADLVWNLQANFQPSDFVFTPPTNGRRIPLLTREQVGAK